MMLLFSCQSLGADNNHDIEEIVIVEQTLDVCNSKYKKYEKKCKKPYTINSHLMNYSLGGAIGKFYQLSTNTEIGVELRDDRYLRHQRMNMIDNYTRTFLLKKRIMVISINFYF